MKDDPQDKESCLTTSKERLGSKKNGNNLAYMAAMLEDRSGLELSDGSSYSW